jgi:hypothetical protein
MLQANERLERYLQEGRSFASDLEFRLVIVFDPQGNYADCIYPSTFLCLYAKRNPERDMLYGETIKMLADDLKHDFVQAIKSSEL